MRSAVVCSTSKTNKKKKALMLHEELIRPWQTGVKRSAPEVGMILRPLRHLFPVDSARVRKHAEFQGAQTVASGVLQPSPV